MPVDADRLHSLLIESSYDKSKTDFLVEGFKQGFDIGYNGDEKIRQESKNLKLIIGDEIDLWNKVMKEVKLKRYAGPFEQPPFNHFIQSPLGLVPKDNGKDMRLIFHLSHPRKDPAKSVNGNIPPELCKVRYPDFSEAIRRCQEESMGCMVARSDFSSALDISA